MLIFGDDLIILYEYEKYIKNRFKKIYIGTLLVINSNKMSKKVPKLFLQIFVFKIRHNFHFSKKNATLFMVTVIKT